MAKKENDIGEFLECKFENKNESGMEAQKMKYELECI